MPTLVWQYRTARRGRKGAVGIHAWPRMTTTHGGEH
jgi:hypothetical protein